MGKQEKGITQENLKEREALSDRREETPERKLLTRRLLLGGGLAVVGCLGISLLISQIDDLYLFFKEEIDGSINEPPAGEVLPTVEMSKKPTPAIEHTQKSPSQLQDGEHVLDFESDVGEILPRTKVGENERKTILELGVDGSGFGGFDRAIVVFQSLGDVWNVNVRQGALTIATWGFLGENKDIHDEINWAVNEHVPSLQHASRDENGQQPKEEEIGVYLLEVDTGGNNARLHQVKAGGMTVQEVANWFDVAFTEGDQHGPVPIEIANP